MLAVTKVERINIRRVEQRSLTLFYISEEVFVLPKRGKTKHFLICVHGGMRGIKSCIHIHDRVTALC